jgi:hypothetical protein
LQDLLRREFPEANFEVFNLGEGYSSFHGLRLLGNHPKLGNLTLNKVAMYHDGTHGDQRAGDDIWPYSATFAPGTRLSYIYTNSGEEGKWEGLDVPHIHIRSFTVEAKIGEEKPYRPIESFGKFTCTLIHGIPTPLGMSLLLGLYLPLSRKMSK